MLIYVILCSYVESVCDCPTNVVDQYEGVAKTKDEAELKARKLALDTKVHMEEYYGDVKISIEEDEKTGDKTYVVDADCGTDVSYFYFVEETI